MSLGIIRVLGIVLFAYLTWRNLRDNYQEDKLITYAWLALLGFLVGARVTYGLVNFGVWNDSWISWFSVWDKPGMSYVGGFLSLLLVNLWFCRANSWKFIPFCEDGLVNTLWLLILLILDEFVRTRFGLETGFYLLFLILMLAITIWGKKKYRSLVWYKSGKKGFAFLMTGFLAFLVLGLMGLYFKQNLSFSIVYWILSLTSLVYLFILGEVFNILNINK